MTEQRRFTEPDPAAAGSGPDTGVDEAEQVESELDEARRAAEEYLGDLRRLAADFDNYRKRVARDQAAQASRATESFVSELLPVLDNLERALDAAHEAGEEGVLEKGVALVRSQLLDALKKHGVKPIEALGKPFDPNFHQALTQVPAPGKPPSTVVQVAEPGYAMHDRVLRAAKVIISQPE